jgi:SAM-dependent methyltransferase
MNQESLVQSTATVPVDLEETYWWYHARKEIIADTVQRYLRPGSEIIDFGSGSGVIARHLVDLGFKVLAADISVPALAACRQRGLNTLDLNNDWPAPAIADCVLACDVLEHVEDDLGLLRKLKLTLRPAGLLIAAVPAYDFLWSGEDYISNHVRRYTRPLLERHVRQAGFSIERSSYFNTILLPLITAVLFYKRLLRPRDMYVSDIEPLPQWQNKILYTVFSAERFILPRCDFPLGASLLVVARNPSSE